MTLEHCEKRSSIRFARTYFLTPLIKDENYFKGCDFSLDEDVTKPSEQGLNNQRNAVTLFNIYNALVQTFEKVSAMFMTNKITSNELINSTHQIFTEFIKGTLNTDKALPKEI